MQINPGDLNKKIKIIKRIIAKDTDGFPVVEDAVLLSTWAQVTNTSGTELQKANSDFAQTKTRFLIRTPKIAINHEYMVEFRGNQYNIVYVNDYNFGKNYTEILGELIKK
jgi:SPP1 family predicted phage head-tail adaptor